MKLIGIFIIAISVLSCDFLTTEDTLVVGKLHVLSPDVEFHSNRRYLLVYIEGGGINNNIIEENVLDVRGNDTLLLIKGQTLGGSYTFYSLDHNAGNQPFRLDTISATQYAIVVGQLDEKYKCAINSKE